MRLSSFRPRVRKLAALRRAAGEAMSRGDWPVAIEMMRHILRLDPSRAGLHTQLGHALKETGDRDGAIAAYRDAGLAMPRDLDSRLHLVSLFRLCGDTHRAAEIYAELLAIDPANPVARRGVIEIGRRDLIEGDAGADALRGLAATLHDATRLAREAIETAPVSILGYDMFRKRHPVAVPPIDESHEQVTILIDATHATAAMLHATLDALGDLRWDRWTAIVWSPASMLDHPVASFAAIDPRIRFVVDRPAPVAGGLVARLDAGSIPSPWSIAWLAFALQRTGADLAYGDHDMLERDWLDGETWSAPTLYDAHDPIGLARGSLPLVVLHIAGLPVDDGVRTLLTRDTHCVHVPRVIASRYVLPPTARGAPGAVLDPGAPADGGPDPVAPPPDTSPDTGIAVIIPTRDQAALLTTAITTMRDKARHPARVRFIVVDNRSTDAARPALDALARTGVGMVPMDEAFNWSRANNLGVAQSDEPILVFANNDVEMLTQDWDERLVALLQDQRIGVVGARLLYPGGTIQHAGILFGTAPRSLGVHEGVGHAAAAPGPSGRWQTRRALSSVTGAFIAIRRDVLAGVGGFDDRLFVGYGDIDLCLRVRAARRLVVYDPGLTLVHHESATRGHNRVADAIAWDESELGILARHWGPVIRFDPAYNPQWAVGGQPFDGFREPPLSDILRHVDLARGGSSWTVDAVAKA